METPSDWVIVKIQKENDLEHRTDRECDSQCQSDGTPEIQRYSPGSGSEYGRSGSSRSSFDDGDSVQEVVGYITVGSDDLENTDSEDDENMDTEFDGTGRPEVESEDSEDTSYDLDEFYDQTNEGQIDVQIFSAKTSEKATEHIAVSNGKCIGQGSSEEPFLDKIDTDALGLVKHVTTEKKRSMGNEVNGPKVLERSSVTACKSDGAVGDLPTYRHALGKDQNHLAEDRLDLAHQTHDSGASSALNMLRVKTDVPGDMPDAHFQDTNQAVDAEDAPSVECSTRFDFTPAATRTDFTSAARKSSNDDEVARGSGALSGHFSAASGRRNPGAKLDSEIRRLTPHSEAIMWATQLDGRVQNYQAQNTGPERKCAHPATAPNNSPHDAATQVTISKNQPADTKPSQCATAYTATGLQRKLPLPDIQSKRLCVERKPAVPHQLRSRACYQDGTVDVSILGDQRFLTTTDPVNLQITFVHSHASGNKGKSDAATLTDAASVNESHGLDARQCGVKYVTHNGLSAHKAVLPPICQKGQQRSLKSTGMMERQSGTHMKAYDFKQIPQKKISPHKRNTVLPPLQTKVFNGKTVAMKKSVHGSGFKKKRKCAEMKQRYSPQNYDIVNLRAQWPPFNTHTDPEASARYQRLVTGLSTLYM